MKKIIFAAALIAAFGAVGRIELYGFSPASVAVVLVSMAVMAIIVWAGEKKGGAHRV